MSLLVRCDEPGCDITAPTSEDTMPIYCGRGEVASGWQTWVPIMLGEEPRHYCPRHHHPWP